MADEQPPSGRRRGGGPLWKRLPLLLAVAFGLWLWRGGGGVVAADHQLVFQMPEDRQLLRKFEYQLYSADGLLLKREAFALPSGAERDLIPPNKVLLHDGSYQVKLFRWVEGAADAVATTLEVNVARDEELYLQVPPLPVRATDAAL